VKAQTKVTIAILLCAGFVSSRAFAQAGTGNPRPATDQPTSKSAEPKRVGDPFPLATCPISGGKLGSMGEPVARLYDGREVRFCCDACPPKFEKDLGKSIARLDDSIIRDQGPLYPLKTSVVTGKDLPAAPVKPFEFVYGNRLIRVGSESEKAEFLKDPRKYLADLDKAVIAAQGKDYPLKACPVSQAELGGDMGDPVDLVVGGRLVRLCCTSCKKDVEKDPAKFIAVVDAARKGEHAPGKKEEGKPHDHGK
jgi:hypothetical protein